MDGQQLREGAVEMQHSGEEALLLGRVLLECRRLRQQSQVLLKALAAELYLRSQLKAAESRNAELKEEVVKMQQIEEEALVLPRLAMECRRLRERNQVLLKALAAELPHDVAQMREVRRLEEEDDDRNAIDAGGACAAAGAGGAGATSTSCTRVGCYDDDFEGSLVYEAAANAAQKRGDKGLATALLNALFLIGSRSYAMEYSMTVTPVRRVEFDVAVASWWGGGLLGDATLALARASPPVVVAAWKDASPALPATAVGVAAVGLLTAAAAAAAVSNSRVRITMRP
jgi:hypothetical protein